MSSKIEPARDEAATEKICIVPGCNRVRETRGLCRACYASALRAVRLGRTDMKTLEKNRLLLPAKPGRHSSHGPMTLALEALKQTNGNGHATHDRA